MPGPQNLTGPGAKGDLGCDRGSCVADDDIDGMLDNLAVDYVLDNLLLDDLDSVSVDLDNAGSEVVFDILGKLREFDVSKSEAGFRILLASSAFSHACKHARACTHVMAAR
jgi:hypothetical protein